MELRGTYKGGGGPDKTILLSAARHSHKNYFILVTYLRDPKDDDFQIGESVKFYGVKNYTEVLDRSVIDLKCIAELNTLVRKNMIDIVHVHDLKTTLLGVILKLLNPQIVIINTAHGWIVNTASDSLKQKLQYALLKLYSIHIAVSEATGKKLLNSGIPSKKVEVLYNAIDTDHWNRINGFPSLRTEYNLSDDVLVVGTVGRISSEKDLLTFFKVAEKILAINSSAEFFVVGDGKGGIVSELKDQVDAMGLRKKIHFTGHRTDLINIYLSFDLFLMTSLTEGLPNTVLEAMALQVPVVATGVGGVPEIIVNGETGLLCPPRDVERLSINCMVLLNSISTRLEFGMNARERICKLFDFSKRMDRIETIYRGVM